MNGRIKFIFLFFFYWLSIFVISRVLFLLYHHNLSFTLNFYDWILIVYHGMKLDVSLIGYFAIFPVLLLLITVFFLKNISFQALKIYNLILLIIVILLLGVDLELYKYWRFRLDALAFIYASNPVEAYESVNWYVSIIGILGAASVIFFLHKLFVKKILISLINKKETNKLISLFFIVLLPALIIPVRGGFDKGIVNVSSVYFHKNNFANHAAINVVWNTAFTLIHKKSEDKYFRYFDDARAKQLTEKLLVTDDSTRYILKTSRPNIVLIIIESYTSKIIEPMGGVHGVTPHFNKLVSEGVFFRNFYANDSRSDKGLVGILCGYPTQGITSIIRKPSKTEKLEYISKSLNKYGYNTGFYYGGDIKFADFQSFTVNGDFEQIITKADFKLSERISNWGAPDHIVLKRLLNDIEKTKKPFFKVCFTLSNHEPFDIPVNHHFKGKDLENRLFSAAYYTDSTINDFIINLKKSGNWDNTLIIMLADHGLVFPGNTLVHGFEKYSIPMVWTGGAIKKDTVIYKYGSQVDLAKTLLHQMKIDAGRYKFSKDLLSPFSNSFALYAYNNGFGLVTDSVRFVFDNVTRSVILKDNSVEIDTMLIDYGKALQQIQYFDYLNK